VELFPDNWSHIFAAEGPLLELIVRGSTLYFAIMIFLRLMPRRIGGELATMDLVFLFLVADAAAHSLGGYSTVTDGLLVIAVLMAWNFLLNFLSFHFPFMERLVSAPSLQIIRNGQLLRRNMRREFITQDELMEHLRQQGIDDLKDVKAAYVEGEGHITVVCHKGTQ
jgi:uncharacterized membrane protein YcaP (DUF421 family)